MNYMVFDVESIGLHGEGFAVGYVVVQEDGKMLEEGVFSCRPDKAQGSEGDREWVAQNVPVLPCKEVEPSEVREWEGPYPLHEIATLMLAAGRDQMSADKRIEGETPQHHPLHDARQSARLLLECLSHVL